MRHSRGETAGRDGQVQLGGAQLEVVAPLGLRVVLVGDRRRESPRVRVRQVVDVLRGQQAFAGESRVARFEHLVGLGQSRGVASGQVGADLRSRRPRAEHRPMADVAVERIALAVGVVFLRQAPDVVIAGGLVVAAADADLVVERLRLVVPHAQQPVGTEPRLGREVGRARSGAHLSREVTHTAEQHRLRVAGRVDELEIVARVPPAARRVAAHAESLQVAAEDAVGVDLRRRVRHRVAVVQVGRGVAQRRADEVGAVALHLVEAQRVRQRARVDVRATVDREPGRDRRRGPEHDDLVDARRGHRREIEREDVGVLRVPPAEVRARRARVGDRARAVDHDEGRAGGGRGRHEVGAFGRARGIPDLVHAHEGRTPSAGRR